MRSGSNSTSTSTSLSGPKSSRNTEPNRASRVMPLALQNAARRFSGMEMFVFMGTQSPWPRNHCRRLSWLQIPCPPLNAQPDDTTGDARRRAEIGHLCLALARALGLPAAGSEVVRFEDEVAIVVERYDRVRTAGTIRRLHQEDMCQIPGLPPTKKYQNEGGPGCAEISEAIRTHSGEPEEDAQTFARAFFRVPEGTPILLAKAGCDNPVLPRIATTSGSGTSTSCTTNPPRSPCR